MSDRIVNITGGTLPDGTPWDRDVDRLDLVGLLLEWYDDQGEDVRERANRVACEWVKRARVKL